MVDANKSRRDHKLNLVAPRRGLKRSRSVLSERGNKPARVEKKHRVNRRSNTEISLDTGHALNWIDSLIRKGRGILNSLEEEEDAFEKEVMEERQRLRICEQLVDSVLNESVVRSSGYGTDTSFKRLDDTIRNSLTNSSDDLQDLQDLQDEQQRQDVAGQDIAILSDEEEQVVAEKLNEVEECDEAEEDEDEQNKAEGSDEQGNEEEKFERYEAEEGEEIDLVSQEEDQEQEIQEDMGNEDEELWGEVQIQGRDEYGQEHEHEHESNDNESNGQRGSEENQELKDQDEELEIAKKLASGLFSALSRRSDTGDHREEFDDGSDPTPITVDENLDGAVLNEGNDDYQEYDGPLHTEEIIIVGEEDEECEEDEQDQGDEEDEENEEDQRQPEEHSKEDSDQVQQEEEGQEEKDQSMNTEGTSSLQMFHDSCDYRTIATQALRQILDTEKGQAANSIVNNNDSFADSTIYQTPEEADREQEQNTEMNSAGIQKTVICGEHEAKKRSNRRSSLFGQLFKPKPLKEDSIMSAASFEDESVYYSVDENMNDKSLGEEESKENFRSSPYEILFCESNYSSSSNEDNQEIEQPVRDYVSPFGENPFIAAREAGDKKELLRRTLESLGESFDSDSEDQAMEDVQNTSTSSDEEYFSQNSEINLNEFSDGDGQVVMEDNDNATIKGASPPSDGDTASDNTFVESRNVSMSISHNLEPEVRFTRPQSQGVDSLLYGPVEPDIIEENESQQSNDDSRIELVLEEVISDTEASTYPLIESNPLIEYISPQPQILANIILDEFTAPDQVEEVESASEIHDDEIMLEDISLLAGDYPLISTEPIVEHPESLPSNNIKIVDIAEVEDQNSDEFMSDADSEPLAQTEDLQVATEGSIDLSALGRRNSENSQEHAQSSLECNATSDGQESSSERHPLSMTSKMFSPSRALTSVISGVRSVGNVLTDFVKTIDVLDSETESENENTFRGASIYEDHHQFSDLSNSVYNDFVKTIDVLDSETESNTDNGARDVSIHGDHPQTSDLSNNVGNVFTDFAATIGVLDSETESNNTNASQDASAHEYDRATHLSKNSNTAVESRDVLMVNDLSSQEIREEYPVLDQESKNTDVLSGITALRQLARAIESKPLSELKDEASSELDESDDRNSEVENSVKNDDQLEIVSTGAEVIRADGNFDGIKDESLTASIGEIEAESQDRRVKGDCMNAVVADDGPIEDENPQDRIPRDEGIGSGRMDDEIMDDEIMEDGSKSDKQIEANAQDAKQENSNDLNVESLSPSPVRHIEVLSDDSENHLKVHQDTENQESIDGAVEVPVELELEKLEAPPQISESFKDPSDNQQSSEGREGSKRKSRRQGKLSAQNDSTNKRKSKSSTTAKPQKKRSRGPTTRSRTNPPPTSRRTRRNNRLRKTR